MTGAKMQPEFNNNVDNQPFNNYRSPKTGGAMQDEMRNEDEEPHDGEQPAADKITDKFSDNAGDNAVTRYEINSSIVAPQFANEHSYSNAMQKAIEEIGKK